MTTTTATTTTGIVRGALAPVRTVDEQTHASGALVRRVQVGDVSDHLHHRDHWQKQVDGWDDALVRDPDLAPPVLRDEELVLRNDASRWLYSSPGMLEWRRDLVPSARALYPMQRPDRALLPSGRPLDEMARGIFLCSSDGIGIRTRAAVMRGLVAERARSAPAPAGERPVWVSLACGAAVPVLDAAAAVPGDHFLHLVDLDADALAFARRLAGEQGLVEGVDYAVHRRDLVRSIVARDALVDEIGQGRAAVVDALGIFEYFSDASCVRLLRNAHRLLAPGGVLVVANMLSDRPHLAMNQRGVGWPGVRPRSVDEVLGLVAAAGLPTERTTVHLPADGVYAVVEVLAREDAPDDGGVIDLRDA